MLTAKTDSFLNQWHVFIHQPDQHILDDLLAEEVTFHSPVIHTPQKGRKLTSMYLMAAAQVFRQANDPFEYIRQVIQEDQIVLEFNVQIEGIAINGVDLISLDEEGKVIDFKVMIRPFKGIRKLQKKMLDQLEKTGLRLSRWQKLKMLYKQWKT